LSEKAKKICPRCQTEGSGPYPRWVKNSRKQRYEPFLYFAHKHGKKIKWCYLGRPKTELSNTLKEHECLNCASLTGDDFCTWQNASIQKELLTQPFDCEGFQPKLEKLSNTMKVKG